jgi:hypothetical protein
MYQYENGEWLSLSLHQWNEWYELVILHCTKCGGIISPVGIPCFFVIYINWSLFLIMLSIHKYVVNGVLQHPFPLFGGERSWTWAIPSLRALVLIILLLDPCLAEISKNHCICAGKYKVRASHPDLKVEVRGSTEVRYAVCPFLSDLQFCPCLLLFA